MLWKQLISALVGRMLLEAIIFITIAILISYITLLFLKSKPGYQGSSAMYDLSKRHLVLPNADLPWSNAPCSLRFAIYIKEGPRTINKVDCIADGDSAPTISFAPSCTDYSYKSCSCAASDCTRCGLTDSASAYLSKLLSIGTSLELWASGYTSQNDKPYVPALLKIRTASDSAQHYTESVPLPALPLQKWTVVTIVKEGRRFDVYFGEKLVTSKLCDHVPYPPGSMDAWYAGNPKWHGKIGLFVGTKAAQSSADVAADVQSLVNTRGEPYFLDDLNLGDFANFSLNMPSCIFGGCNNLPAVKPLNPFASYVTNVQ
jgi:hypothetical protein